ncbi:hypothetical protein V1506DRAFT_494407 [Lipomyces tetrasporus]
MDRIAPSSAGTPAPYGHSCATCAKSKRKCIVRRSGEPCERCYKTNKECRPAKTERRRHANRPVVSKATRLEEKIDSLMSLMKAGAQSDGAKASSSARAGVINPVFSGSAEMNAPIRNPHENGSGWNCLSDDHNDTPTFTSPTTSSPGSDHAGEPSPMEAEECLTHFQTFKLQYFPFVYISSTTSAQNLQKERPFLWLCIMAVSTKSTSQQQVLGSRIRQTIAQEMVVRSEKNIDLLLGLLTFIGWANYQVHTKPFLALFTQLAVSLVFDLRLNKPVPEDTSVMSSSLHQKFVRFSAPRTMEERRAVLGCFLVTSIISSFLQKIDALHWTPYLDECLQMLDETKECLNDESLVQQVRLQLIAEKAARSTSYDAGPEKTENIPDFHSQLENAKACLLTASPKNAVVLLHLYSIELEVALSATFLSSDQITAQQRKSLRKGFESIMSWFDVVFAIPPNGYVGFPFSIFSQLVRCLITLYRLVTLDDPTWDKNQARETAKPLSILNLLISNLEQVPVVAGLDNRDSAEGDVFSRSAQIFRSLRSEWEAKLGLDDMMSSMIPPSQNASDIAFPDALGEEILDNDWFMDLLSSTF